MLTREETLQRIEASRSELDRLVSSLQPADFDRAIDDGWTIKDHLAHIACWEEEVVAIFAGIPRYESLGLPADSPILTDTDAINGIFRGRWSQASTEGILGHYGETHRRLLVLLHALGDADLESPISRFVPMPEAVADHPVFGWVEGNTWEHYDEHTAAIRELMAAAS
jgi:hypothetical protein